MSDTCTDIVFIAGTLFTIVFTIMIVLLIARHKRKSGRCLRDTPELKQKLSQELLLAQVEAQEQSYQYFSEEVHDHIGPSLMLAQVGLFQSVEEIDNAAAKERVRASAKIIEGAIADLRAISHRLGNQYISKEGLIVALERELEYLKNLKNLSFSLEILDRSEDKSEPYRADRKQDLLIFRIIQESIANSIKHARPSHLSIRLSYLEEGIEAVVRDDGTGFDIRENLSGAKAGIGLLNMQRRAELLNSDLVIHSKPGSGTTIRLTPKKP